MSEDQPKPRPPQYRIPRSLYVVVAVVMAVWVAVTFFLRNPYTQATQGDYYERHSFDEGSIWTIVLVVVPLIGFAAFFTWTRRKRG